MPKKTGYFPIVLFFLCAGAAFAHSGATGIVKERMDMMSEIGDDMKLIGNMVRGKTPYDAAEAQRAALAVSTHAGDINKMFPPGSLSHPTEALPAIWENWNEFADLSDALLTSANRLAEQTAGATSGAQLQEQFMRVGKVCSACHEKFRVKK